jgi:hypothetical protein
VKKSPKRGEEKPPQRGDYEIKCTERPPEKEEETKEKR